jgi:hypothetical protein
VRQQSGKHRQCRRLFTASQKRHKVNSPQLRRGAAEAVLLGRRVSSYCRTWAGGYLDKIIYVARRGYLQESVYLVDGSERTSWNWHNFCCYKLSTYRFGSIHCSDSFPSSVSTCQLLVTKPSRRHFCHPSFLFSSPLSSFCFAVASLV